MKRLSSVFGLSFLCTGKIRPFRNPRKEILFEKADQPYPEIQDPSHLLLDDQVHQSFAPADDAVEDDAADGVSGCV